MISTLDRPAILRRAALVLVATVLALCGRTEAEAPLQSGWPGWGGPHRNFTSDTRDLALTWPAQGPRRLWSRALGEGHSSILVDNGRLYSMYRPIGLLSLIRRSQEEVIVSMDAATGRTVWEHRYDAPTDGLDFVNGAGPHATPLVVGDRLFATGTRRELFALDKNSGRVLWSHDLTRVYGGQQYFDRLMRPGAVDRGYTCSPLPYKDNIIVTLGGSGQAVVSFKQASGQLVWKAGSVEWAPASPILIQVDGQEQVVVFGGDYVVGMDPNDGRTLWSHPHKTDWGMNISTPVWSPADNLLFVSSAYGAGSRAIELRQAGGKTTVTEKWHSPRMRIHIGTAVRIGDHVYGSSDPGVFTAINIKTGAVAWQNRAFVRSQVIAAGSHLIVLDEDGTLGLASVSPQGLQVLARAEILDSIAWTPPTLVGSTLYIRDRKSIMALDLARGQ